ncbi:unnamed protein product [Orchesella dallaii]|uniref:Uncharacterized protein n=1 Tax=Orchesella dallaii TaxID=48710 RepID=A0ABP1Q4K2_9HEXA
MCKSVRGAAFFGSSLHLAFSFIFLFWFIFDTVISEININLWKCEPPEQKFSEIDPLAHYLNLLFKLLYFTGLCATGIYMFRGVEREKPQILKFATLAFIILQVLAVILFSVFFSIQWNVEPETDSLLPEPARLTSEGTEGAEGLPVSPNNTKGTCNCNTDPVPVPLSIDLVVPEASESESEIILSTVTPIISENVLAAPDINGTLTTTTTSIPAPALSELPVVNIVETTSTTTPAPALPLPPPVPISPSASPKSNKSKLPHNQLVSLVFQMCLVIFNGLGSVAYVIVLGIYMLKL